VAAEEKQSELMLDSIVTFGISLVGGHSM